MFTFVIPAYNEEMSIEIIVAQTRDAMRPGDRLLVVDSASTDGTAQRAADAGAEVLSGPRGKGAAMAVGIAQARTPWICFLDADLFEARTNVPAALRAAAATGTADHVLGDYEYADPGTVLCSTFTIYEPLVATLFPEVGHLGANALTGYRAIRREFLEPGRAGRLPRDLGIESYLNITVAVTGGTAGAVHLGVIGSRFRYKADMGREIGRTILDLAVAHGRIDPVTRPRWDQWVEDAAAVIAGLDGTTGRSASLSRLFAAVRRPQPAHSVSAVNSRAPRGQSITASTRTVAPAGASGTRVPSIR